MYDKHGGTHELLFQKWRKAVRTVETSDVLMFSEWVNGGYKAFKAWAWANGYKDGLCLKRKDANEGYYPANIMWVSKSEAKRRSRNVLSDDEVREVKAMLRDGKTYSEISLKFGVNRDVVRMIARGVTYKHVE